MNTMHSAADRSFGMKQLRRQRRRSLVLRLSGRCGSAVWRGMISALAWAATVLPFRPRWSNRGSAPFDDVRVRREVMLRGLMASLVVGLLAGLWTGSSLAKAYGNHDMRQLLVSASTPGAGGSLNLTFLDGVLADLSAHAADYPPKFDSPADIQRARKDARILIGMLSIAFGAAPPDELLFRMALLGAFGHNLDVPDAAVFAQTHFLRLLSTDAEHAMGNYHYGVFLAGIGRPKESLPYLNKARDKGVIPALYSIGVAQMTLGDKTSALVALNEYQKRNPTDQNVKMLVDAIQDGKVDMRSEQNRQKP